MWVEQSYKQVKHSLGWSQYQVRSDLAIRRHWELVCCAFSFCWYNQSHSPAQKLCLIMMGNRQNRENWTL